MKIFAGLSVRSFASLLGVCVVGLLSLQCQARANELEDSFMSDSKLSVYIKNETDYPSGTVSIKDLKGFRKDVCELWQDFNRFPNKAGIKSFCIELLGGSFTASEGLSNSSRQSSSSASSSDLHSECLNARDYEGCIRVRGGGVSPAKADNCAPDKWCKATAGLDILGKPKIEGWCMKSSPESQDVGYLRPRPRKVLVRGKTDTYIAREMVIRYYQSPRAGTAPTTTTIGSSTTNCYDAGYSIKCTTTPATTITSPGVAARPGGVVQYSVTTIIDCQEMTVGNHRGSRLEGKWVDLSETPHQKLADNFCPIVESLEQSSFMKYAK